MLSSLCQGQLAETRIIVLFDSDRIGPGQCVLWFRIFLDGHPEWRMDSLQPGSQLSLEQHKKDQPNDHKEWDQERNGVADHVAEE